MGGAVTRAKERHGTRAIREHAKGVSIMDSTAPTGGNSSPSLEDELKAKQASLLQVQAEIQQNTQEVNALQADINVLNALRLTILNRRLLVTILKRCRTSSTRQR